MWSGFLLTPKQTFLHPQNRSKASKSMGVITISNVYTSKILGQDVSIRRLFGLLTETLGVVPVVCKRSCRVLVGTIIGRFGFSYTQWKPGAQSRDIVGVLGLLDFF